MPPMTKLNCALIGLALLIVLMPVTILVYTFEYRGKIMKLLIVLMLAALPAWGQETLNYTGLGMNGSFYGSFNSAIAADVVQITGDVVLAQVLNPNEANQLVTPVSYSFGGILTSSLAYLGDASNTFLFSTHNGNIVGWDVMVSNSNNPAYFSQSLVSTANGDTYGAQEVFNECFAPTQGGTCSVYHASNTMGGVWVDPPSISMKTTAVAPEINSTYAVPALTL